MVVTFTKPLKLKGGKLSEQAAQDAASAAPEKAKKRSGPRGVAPGKKLGTDCKHLTVKLKSGEQTTLLVWAKSQRSTMRALFVQAVGEFLADPPEHIAGKMDALAEAEQVMVLVSVAVWQAVTNFAKAHGSNKQTILTLALERFKERHL